MIDQRPHDTRRNRCFRPGDIVNTALHRGQRHLECEVVRLTVTGRVVVRGRSGRRMTLRPYQLELVKARAE